MRKLYRIVFSRYFLSGALIFLDVVLLSLLIAYASVYSYIVAGVALLLTVAILFDIINRETAPEYKIPWLITVLILPVMGAVIYLLFSRRKLTKGEMRRMNAVAGALSVYRNGDEPFLALKEESPAAAGKAASLLGDDILAEVYRGTASRVFSQGEEMLNEMMFDLKSATRYIFLEYFIIAPGKIWDEIHRILLNKVRAGLDVRLIYDDIGCMTTLPAHFDRELNAEGIRCLRFATVTPRVTVSHNNRDHRKICIIDGRIAYTGGVNLADEYANLKERFGHWKDGGIRLEGDAVAGLLKSFITIWDVTAQKTSDYAAIFSRPDEEEPVAADGGYYIPFGSGPSPFYPRSVGKSAFRSIIDQAQAYVYITTPYLLVDYDLTESICGAARRGVDVRIITPSIPDKKLIKVLTKSSYAHLIASGVRISEYLPGFIHEKTLVSDGEYAVIGTLNFDYRSFVHHFENAVWMFRTGAIRGIRAGFLETERLCRRISSEEAKLSRPERWICNALRLFQPLL